MKSNRLQNKDPADQIRIARRVTIKVKRGAARDVAGGGCAGPVSATPPGSRINGFYGAVI
ncbi:hypothetical protein CKO_02604 [Citrobacter koseri ATCC BAA-895]|uniref:Uncharacterized protein n=1 Tax=Citrobacter koseri (strain ATCC BAA-895 / CDC 4225-83 / SGSC4696) TaxID=290338 RepID=A8AJQ0_CITK8|nr:hypothetical protein CKO_02604 [Citrobacter koseri ATCC BAA-895]BCL47558.1 hypothetical protein MPUCK001_13760 [Citrobacter koseri]